MNSSLPSRTPGRILLLVGDTNFAKDSEGYWHTHGALSRQLDLWFAEFDQVVVAAHIRDGLPPPDYRQLVFQNLKFVSLHKAGGVGLASKLRVALAAISWVSVLARLMWKADAVHLRSPCNVTLIGIPLARVLCSSRYAIYADNWEPLRVEPISYRIQRWMLRYFGGVVHVYAPDEQELTPNLRRNLSPSFTNAELDLLEPTINQRKILLETNPIISRDLRLACIASFSERKNQEALVRAVSILKSQGIRVQLRLAGEGPNAEHVRAVVDQLGLDCEIELLGQIGRSDVEELLRWADINLLVSLAEGYGKVLLEGMSVGCPAICGPGAMQYSIVGGTQRGRVADPPSPSNIASAINSIRILPIKKQIELVDNCRLYVRRCTLEAFGDEVKTIVRAIWQMKPSN